MNAKIKGAWIESDSLEKFVNRQGNKPRIYGVHLAVWKNTPGESVLRHYIQHNPDYAKVMIKEELACIKILQGRINLP